MQSKDMLQLAVRLLGLVFLYHALQAVPPALVQIIGSFPHRIGQGILAGGSFGQFCTGVFIVGWPLLVSCWLLRGAPLLMRLAYPDPPVGTPAERAFEAQAIQQAQAKL